MASSHPTRSSLHSTPAPTPSHGRPGWLIGLLAVLSFAAEPHAATKYVAMSGSDANDGDTAATAYATVAKGLQNIGSGGRLYIRGGTYPEAILHAIPSGKSATERTTVSNYEHETVTIRPAAGPARVLEFMGDDRFITVAANAPGEIILDGANVGHNVVKFSAPGSGGAGDWPSHIRLENLEIKNGPDSGVLGYPSHCEFIRLHIHHAGTTVFDHGMYIAGSDNLIEGCDIHDNYARGIQIFMSKKERDTTFASRNVVRHCRIHHNGLTSGKLKPGIDADSGSGNRILDNVIYNNGQFGLMIQMGGTANEAYRNTFFANGTAAAMVKASAGPGNVLRDNIAVAADDTQGLINERADTVVGGNTWAIPAASLRSRDPAQATQLGL